MKLSLTNNTKGTLKLAPGLELPPGDHELTAAELKVWQKLRSAKTSRERIRTHTPRWPVHILNLLDAKLLQVKSCAPRDKTKMVTSKKTKPPKRSSGG